SFIFHCSFHVVFLFFYWFGDHPDLHSFPTRRSSDLDFVHKLGKVAYHVPCHTRVQNIGLKTRDVLMLIPDTQVDAIERCSGHDRSEEHTSELQSRENLVCRLLLEKKKTHRAPQKDPT